MSKAIIIGATSGIGKELAKVFSAKGFEVGLMGRREELLEKVAQELSCKVYVKKVDIAVVDEAMARLKDLLREMGQVEVIVVVAGVGFINKNLDWRPEEETIATNVYGFAAMCNVAMNFFAEQSDGQLVAVSSIAAIRGSAAAPAYAASKAFVSNYLEGLRIWAYKNGLPVIVTEVQPGFVDTDMAKGDGLFWMATAEKAAEEIFTAVVRKRSHAYITGRWRLIAWFLKVLPGCMIKRFG